MDMYGSRQVTIWRMCCQDVVVKMFLYLHVSWHIWFVYLQHFFYTAACSS